MKNKAAGRDDVLVEQLKNRSPVENKWLLTMLNTCTWKTEYLSMETIEDYRYTEAMAGLCDAKELPANIPRVTRV